MFECVEHVLVFVVVVCFSFAGDTRNSLHKFVSGVFAAVVLCLQYSCRGVCCFGVAVSVINLCCCCFVVAVSVINLCCCCFRACAKFENVLRTDIIKPMACIING